MSCQHVNTLIYGNGYMQNMMTKAARFDSRFRMLIRIVEKYAKGDRLVDVGCGLGFFLRYARQHLGSRWSLAGVEPNSALKKAASGISKVKVVQGVLGKLPFADNSMDVVTCLDVLEHDLHINRNVAELKRVLTPGGILIIQAPNYKSLMAKLAGSRWDWWSPPDHVFHFSYLFLNKYLITQGFNVLHAFTYESSEDFLNNIRGVWAKHFFSKLLFLIITPILLIAERIAWKFKYGGLLVIVCSKEVA